MTSPPAWFRYAVIAIAALVMCSCAKCVPASEVAGVIRVLSEASEPQPALTPDSSPQVESSQSKWLPAGVENLQQPAAVSPQRQDVEARKILPAPKRKPPVIDAEIKAAAYELPTHLTAAQLAQAKELPPGFVPAPCACSCGAHGCNEMPAHGPGDEYLCDGGDYNLPAAVTRSGAITGLEPEDAVAHYQTIDGRTIITPSNKVCIYAPRFAAVRQVIDVRAYANIQQPEGRLQASPPVGIAKPLNPGTTLAEIEPNIDRQRQPPSLFRERGQPGELARDQRPGAAIGTLAPYANIEVVRTGEVVGVDIPRIARASLAAITWTGIEAPQVLIDNRAAHTDISVQTPGTIYLLVEPNNPKLRLIKLACTDNALPGEEVEFTLRYDNVGDRVIGNVVIADHLTTRLEYIAESQKSSRAANFSVQPATGDSFTLRWEITEPLQPGEGGVLQFRTRVR